MPRPQGYTGNLLPCQPSTCLLLLLLLLLFPHPSPPPPSLSPPLPSPSLSPPSPSLSPSPPSSLLCVCVYTCDHVKVCMWKSEGSLLEPILFHCGFWRFELRSSSLATSASIHWSPYSPFPLSLAVLLDLLSLLQSLVELASFAW